MESDKMEVAHINLLNPLKISKTKQIWRAHHDHTPLILCVKAYSSKAVADQKSALMLNKETLLFSETKTIKKIEGVWFHIFAERITSFSLEDLLNYTEERALFHLLKIVLEELPNVFERLWLKNICLGKLKESNIFLSVKGDCIEIYNISGQIKTCDPDDPLKSIINGFENYIKLLLRIVKAKNVAFMLPSEILQSIKMKDYTIINEESAVQLLIAELKDKFDYLKRELGPLFFSSKLKLLNEENLDISKGLSFSFTNLLQNSTYENIESRLFIYNLLENSSKTRELLDYLEGDFQKKNQKNPFATLRNLLFDEPKNEEFKYSPPQEDQISVENILQKFGPVISPDTMEIVFSTLKLQNDDIKLANSLYKSESSEFNKMKPLKINQQFLDKVKDLEHSQKRPFEKCLDSVLEGLAAQGSPEWFEFRKSRLTCSNFGKVCQGSLSHANIRNKIEDIMYPKNLEMIPAVNFGIQKEPIARDLFRQKFPELIVREPGIFLNKYFPWLGGSPDGVIGLKDKSHSAIDSVVSKRTLNHMEEKVGNIAGILEIKSPYSLKDCENYDQVFAKKDFYLKISHGGEITLDKSHTYYFQIQGLLHIMDLEFCILAVFLESVLAPQEKLICVEVQRDAAFIKNMITTLHEFYIRFMLPEFIFRRKKIAADFLYIDSDDYRKAMDGFFPVYSNEF